MNPLTNTQNKDTYFDNELKTIFNYLQDNIATASMVSEATGVKQKNICRYKADLEKQNNLWEVEKKHCKATGRLAWYLTTNPKFKPNDNQLNLF